MANVGLATLMTDFGTRDPYVAAMKGVIYNVSPMARVVDICHEIPPHDVLTGAFIWVQSAPYFPPGTVHVGVVDPGVGSDRRILAALLGEQVFIFPDNGLISFIASSMPMEAIVEVAHVPELVATDPSPTFHGRDIFAPVAAGLLNGMEIEELGPDAKSYKTIDIPEPSGESDSLTGQVLYVDRFGNLITNLSVRALAERWENAEGLRIFCGSHDAGPINANYSQVAVGQVLTLFNSMGVLEIAVNQGSAAEMLAAAPGTEVKVVAT